MCAQRQTCSDVNPLHYTAALILLRLLGTVAAFEAPDDVAGGPKLRRLLDVLTGGAALRGRPEATLCLVDETLTLQLAASPAEFGPKWTLFKSLTSNTTRAASDERELPKPSTIAWVGGGRRRRACSAGRLQPGLRRVLQQELFPFTVGRLHRVLLDHLERVFDLGMVYHDFYSGALAEGGGPLQRRPALVKALSEFAIGEEGDPEGYAYPKGEESGVQVMKPTSALRLVGQFFYHAHNRTQCGPNPCSRLSRSAVVAWHLQRVAPLHMRKAFCNYYHFTTVGLARLVALLPRLRADTSIMVLVPHTNWKGQTSHFISESLRALGIEESRVRAFPPCRLVFADEVLVAGTGPRAAFGRGPDGHDRSVMADIADTAPTRAVRASILRLLPFPQSASRGGVVLIDRLERRGIANLQEVKAALELPPLTGSDGPLYCENMSFVAQVARFRIATTVVAVHGACLTNSLYMPRGALVVDVVPVKNFMGAGLFMPLDCGVTWFWTLTSNVGVHYRPLLLSVGDFDAAMVRVPVAALRSVLLGAADDLGQAMGPMVSRGLARRGGEASLPAGPRGDSATARHVAARPPLGSPWSGHGHDSADPGTREQSLTMPNLGSPKDVAALDPGQNGGFDAPGCARLVNSLGHDFVGSCASKAETPEYYFDCGHPDGRGHPVATSGMCAAVHGRPWRSARKTEAANRAWEQVDQECLGRLLQGLRDEALGCLDEAFWARRAPERARHAGTFMTTLRKLRHDSEMLRHLEARGLLGPGLAGAAEFFWTIYEAASKGRERRADSVFEVQLPAGDARRDLWARLHNTALHMPTRTPGPGPAIGAGVQALAEAEADLARYGNAVIDRPLSVEALRGLRSLLQEASFYFYPSRGGSYLLALLEDGLAQPVMAAVAEGFRAALPRALGPHRLCEACAWKADNSRLPGLPDPTPSPGLEPGGAAMALLLWTVPQQALASHEPPPLMLPRADGSAVPVTYAVNRAVLWRDDCPAAAPRWQGMQFGEGYMRRGVHLVLRFGLGWPEAGSA